MTFDAHEVMLLIYIMLSPFTGIGIADTILKYRRRHRNNEK